MFQKNNSGQALIIIVLIIALVLTVIAASSYQLTVETKSSKLQEESVRALAAADAGIEVGLQIANTNPNLPPQSYTFASQNILLPGVDAVRSEIFITNTSQSDFVSSMILKDDQFTFYTSDYPSYLNPYNGTLRLFFGSEGAGDCNSRTAPALELTIMYGANNDMERRVVEPCTAGLTIGTTSLPVTSAPVTVGGITYNYQADINMGAFSNAKMMIVRSLFSNTRVRFVAQAGTFPDQGKNIEARAFSISGPSKIVTIFQSLPQIPADFFVTSF